MESLRENYASPLVRKGSTASLYNRKKFSGQMSNNSSLLLNTSASSSSDSIITNNNFVTPMSGSKHHNNVPPTMSVKLSSSYHPTKDIKVSISKPSSMYTSQPQQSFIKVQHPKESATRDVNDSKRRLYSELLESSIQSIINESSSDRDQSSAQASTSGLDFIKDLYSANNNSFIFEEQPSSLFDSSERPSSSPQPPSLKVSIVNRTTEETSSIMNLHSAEPNVANLSSTNIHTNDTNNLNSSLLIDTIKQDINGVDELILFSPLSTMNESTIFDIDLSNENENDLVDSLDYLTNYKHINLLNLSNCSLNISSLVVTFNEIKFITILNLSNSGLVCNDIKCLCENLKQQNSTLKELILSNNSISNKGMVSIGKFLTEKNTLKKLHLNNNKFTVLGCKAICYGMMLNSSLSYLNLSNNNLQNCHFIINQLLQYSKHLKCVEMNECQLFSQEYYFTINNGVNINILNLEGNNLGDFITKQLFSTLSINTSIHTLYLKKNNITNDCTNTINTCLKNNCKLLFLDLSENMLSSRATFLFNETCNTYKKNIVVLTNDQDEVVEEEEEEGDYVLEEQETQLTIDSNNSYSGRSHLDGIVEEEISSEPSLPGHDIDIYDNGTNSNQLSSGFNNFGSNRVTNENTSYQSCTQFPNTTNTTTGTEFPILYHDSDQEYYANYQQNHMLVYNQSDDGNGSVIEIEEDDDNETIVEEEYGDNSFVNEDDIVGEFLSNFVSLDSSSTNPLQSLPVVVENSSQTTLEDRHNTDYEITNTSSSLENLSGSSLNASMTDLNSTTSSLTTTKRREALSSLSKIRDQYISPMKKPSSMNQSLSQLMKQLNY